LPDDLPELADIQRLATQFDPQEVQLFYQIVVHGRNEIGLAPDEYAGFTMTLLRMLAFRPGQGGADQAAAPAPAALARAMPQAAPARPAAAVAAPAAQAARPAAPGAAAAASASAHASAPAPAPAPSAPPAAQGGAGRAMTSARAALDAALEAARAGSRMGGVPRRPAPSGGAQATGAPATGAPAAASPAAGSPAAGSPAAAAPSASAAPAGGSPAGASAAAAPTAPWGAPSQATAQPQPAMVRQSPAPQAVQGHPAHDEAAADDGPPAWVTEFSDDTAVAMDAPAVAAPSAPARVAAQSAPAYAYVITPIPAIDWDGNWPALAASLPLRGVAQQLAFQTELVECVTDGAAATFRLRVPVDTLRASGNSEKLCAALQERFPAVRVNVETEIAPTWYTANAEARARRERLQREAEAAVDADPFVQDMARTFDAFVVPGSVRPIAT
jgi:DNA polymerase-3 subunit gamma/tau